MLEPHNKLIQFAMSHFIEPVTMRDDGTFVDLDRKSYGPWEILEASASLPQS